MLNVPQWLVFIALHLVLCALASIVAKQSAPVAGETGYQFAVRQLMLIFMLIPLCVAEAGLLFLAVRMLVGGG